MERYDAVVIGGGPAGLAAAIAAARAGLSVLVAEVQAPPVDKLCGEGLLPDALEALRFLGVFPAGVPLASSENGARFDGISFHDGRHAFGGTFSGHPGFGMKRIDLHTALSKAAEREGVTLRWRVRAELASSNLVRVDGHDIACRYVIGADGHSSAVRLRAGLSTRASHPENLRKRQRLASGVHYRCAPWSRFVEVHWAKKVQAYVTPVGVDEVSIAVICRDRQVRALEALELFPVLQERLLHAGRIGKEQGAVSRMLHLPRVVTDDVALIGEASGSVDAITGEGLSLAFRQAVALGAALRSGHLLSYEREHRRILWRSRWMARLLLSLSDYPPWRSRVFQAFASEPRAFENLLRMHVGALPKVLGAGSCSSLLANLLLGAGLS